MVGGRDGWHTDTSVSTCRGWVGLHVKREDGDYRNQTFYLSQISYNILKKYKNIFQSSQIFFMSRCLNVNPKILTTIGQFLLLKSSEHGTESKLCKLCKTVPQCSHNSAPQSERIILRTSLLMLSLNWVYFLI